MLGGAQLGNKFLKGVICELSPISSDYRLWDDDSSEDVSFVEAKDVLGSDFGQSFGFYPFGEVVDDYYQIFFAWSPP